MPQPLSTRRIASLALMVAAGTAVALLAGCAVSRLNTAKALAKASQPYQQSPAGAKKRLLVVGDSTGVGTGASTPAASVVGRFGQAHPDWAIVNRAADGARFADLSSQLGGAERFDAVLVLCGGNDVIRLTGEDELRRGVQGALTRASALAPKVVVMPPGNVGNAPFFWPPVTAWMRSRSKTLHAIVADAASASGAAYVRLYKEREDDPFAQQPERMNAADGLHPSDEGYALWYSTLMQQGQLGG